MALILSLEEANYAPVVRLLRNSGTAAAEAEAQRPLECSSLPQQPASLLRPCHQHRHRARSPFCRGFLQIETVPSTSCLLLGVQNQSWPAPESHVTDGPGDEGSWQQSDSHFLDSNSLLTLPHLWFCPSTDILVIRGAHYIQWKVFHLSTIGSLSRKLYHSENNLNRTYFTQHMKISCIFKVVQRLCLPFI